MRDKLAPQLGRDEGRGFRSGEQDVEHLIAVERTGLTQHGLVAVVVLVGAPHVRLRVGVETPPCVGTRGFRYVALRVVPFAERE
jgi:hypothetical protein